MAAMKQPDTTVPTEPVTREPVPPPTYAHRALHTLEPHYSAHVSAMTSEGLHSKSDIAAELAFRDVRIDALWDELGKARAALKEVYELADNMKTISMFPRAWGAITKIVDDALGEPGRK